VDSTSNMARRLLQGTQLRFDVGIQWRRGIRFAEQIQQGFCFGFGLALFAAAEVPGLVLVPAGVAAALPLAALAVGAGLVPAGVDGAADTAMVAAQSAAQANMRDRTQARSIGRNIHGPPAGFNVTVREARRPSCGSSCPIDGPEGGGWPPGRQVAHNRGTRRLAERTQKRPLR